jgi:hypothetical protein
MIQCQAPKRPILDPKTAVSRILGSTGVVSVFQLPKDLRYQLAPQFDLRYSCSVPIRHLTPLPY